MEEIEMGLRDLKEREEVGGEVKLRAIDAIVEGSELQRREREWWDCFFFLEFLGGFI